MTSKDHAVLEHRRRFADLVTDMLCQAGIVLEQEQLALAQRFPAVVQSNAVMTTHAAIRNFLVSDAYKEVLDSYLAGKLETNLLAKVLTMLEQLAPLEFLRKAS